MKAKLDNQYLSLLRKFPLAPIKNKQQLNEAIALMKDLTAPTKMSALTDSENDYLDVLSDLIAQYEKRHWIPLDKPMTPAEALQYLLEQSGITQSTLAVQAGVRQSHISEFLSGIRQLSKESIMKISAFFRISPVLFLERNSSFSYSGLEVSPAAGALGIREGKEIRSKKRKH